MGSNPETITRGKGRLSMKIAGIYSFNNGRKVIEERYEAELKAVQEIIGRVNADTYKTKISKEPFCFSAY